MLMPSVHGSLGAFSELSRAFQLQDLEAEMEGGGEQHDQQVDGQENGDAEEQKDKEKEKLKIPEIGFIRKKDTKG